MRAFLALLFAGAAMVLATEPEEIVRERLSAGESSVEGVDGWRFLPAELKHLLASDPAGDPKNPLAAIKDFQEQLQRLGIRLIVVPVPPKAAIHPGQLDARLAGKDLDQARKFFESLRAQNVEVLDLTTAFAQARDSGPLYCARDSHWNGKAVEIAAKAIAQTLGNVAANRIKPEAKSEKVEIQGDLGGSPESVDLRVITLDGKPVPVDRGSPILLLGDSHVLVFHEGGEMHAAGAGLPDQLAFELGVPVDVLAVRGSGATAARVSLARRARADAGYLPGKKVVIWCFGARELTQADAWKSIPLLKPAS